MQLEWWYWIIAGVCLIGIELVLPSFTIIWFGLAALLVGIVKCLLPGLNIISQILLLGVASAFFAAMWVKYLKGRR